jgi:uncharacterized protein DUF1579
MRKISILLFVIPTVFFCHSAVAQTQDEMKAWMAYSTPGEIHKLMAKSVGTWDGNITMWMKPGAPAMNSTGVLTNTMIMGGRYLQGMNTGNFMGQPFEGIGMTGYDNAKKMFVSSWIDNMGTGMLYLTGSWDAATNSIKLSGMEVDPVTGKDIPIREVLKFIDDNNQVLEMYSTAGGQEYKAMEIKYVRK